VAVRLGLRTSLKPWDITSLQRFVEARATTILLRVVGYDQKGRFKRVTEEILPALS